MIIYKLIILLLGLFLVIKGADVLISCSTSLGKKFGFSELIIGIVIIGFGTSLSELLVSIDAVLKNAPELSLGNVLGSNIANIFLVIASAGITKAFVLPRISNLDNTFHIFSHFLFLLIFLFFQLNFTIGCIFLVMFFIYLFSNLRSSNKEKNSVEIDNNNLARLSYKQPLLCGIPIVILSVLITLLGAELTVNSTIKISNYFGISESFIGLTIIALGTSLPEIATGIIAVNKGRINLIIGNILGSNIYNLLLILGFVSLFESFDYNKNELVVEVIILFLSVCFFWVLTNKKQKIDLKLSVAFFGIYLIYLLNLFYRNFI
ncbi:MAG: hypothetical protein CMP34_01635 [Rickettsiales bacterium]|nr:hypothetical protein [Rickettsiales bacterium]